MLSNFSSARLENIDFDPADEISTQETLQYLEWLMQWYCREPSMLLATIIVSRLEWLRVRHANCEVATPELSYSRLIRDPEYLATRGRRKQQRHNLDRPSSTNPVLPLAGQ